MLSDVIELDTAKEGKKLRLVFAITSLRHPRYQYRAGKNYLLAKADKLAGDLDDWLGDDLIPLVNTDGAISIEALKGLMNREVDLEIVNLSNDKFKTDFRHIVRLLPPRTLVEDQSAAA